MPKELALANLHLKSAPMISSALKLTDSPLHTGLKYKATSTSPTTSNNVAILVGLASPNTGNTRPHLPNRTQQHMFHVEIRHDAQRINHPTQGHDQYSTIHSIHAPKLHLKLVLLPCVIFKWTAQIL